jgi:hypothetical protein
LKSVAVARTTIGYRPGHKTDKFCGIPNRQKAGSLQQRSPVTRQTGNFSSRSRPSQPGSELQADIRRPHRFMTPTVASGEAKAQGNSSALRVEPPNTNDSVIARVYSIYLYLPLDF